MPKSKARSRLKDARLRSKRTVKKRKKQLSRSANYFSERITKHLRFWPLLVLSGLFYGGTYWLINQYHPEQIRNLLIPNSFIPFHALLLPANFFLFTFLTLSKRWGILIALIIQWLLFLKLQNFLLDEWAVGSALLIGLLGYLVRSLINRRSAD
jgi:hypothetical protein